MAFAIKVKFSGQEGIMAASGSGQWKVFLYSTKYDGWGFSNINYIPQSYAAI